MQEKYEEAMILYAQMEKRAVMAETMLEATIQYQSSQLKAHQSVPASPRYFLFFIFRSYFMRKFSVKVTVD